MRYIVGIDLGTTNCAVAYADRRALQNGAELQDFAVPQLTRLGHVEARPLLPSFNYLAAFGELPDGSGALPWNDFNTAIVGELARNLGAKVPGRLVASAKSWLCHPHVDRTAAILPWGAPETVKKTSPVQASARYLTHLREAWDHEIAGVNEEKTLAKQALVITVPASFDEAARELTVQAAQAAGLGHAVLLEEPQAAFYAWLARQGGAKAEDLSQLERVLICDVGGGTTDFSMIEVRAGKDAPELKRSAVGDHLMLGGDNMDFALGRMLEKKFAGTGLDSHQFKALAAAARDAKEKLFADNGPARVPVTVVGRGTSVIAGTQRTDLLRDEAESSLLDGFFPRVPLNAEPGRANAAGLREWGLPYASDPAITKHLARFLRRHGSAAPTHVLFNGGAMKPAAFRARILDCLADWFGARPVELAGAHLDLAVARGAAYYAGVRLGSGLRIGGGLARAYYVGLDAQAGDCARKAVCLVPRGTEEGAKLQLPQTFLLRVGAPVAFGLYASSVREGDGLGALVDVASNQSTSEDLAPLPPLETTLEIGRRATKKEVAVRLGAELTVTGTLALQLASVEDERTWEVKLNVRGAQEAEVPAEGNTPAPTPSVEQAADVPLIDPTRVSQAVDLLRATFDPANKTPLAPGALGKQLEAALGLGKEAWPAPVARQMADILLDLAVHRKRSAELEARWLNLAGFLLRPGFGSREDPERMRRLYNALRTGLQFVSDPNSRIEWWVLWRRVSAGMKEDQQRELYNRLQPFLTNDRDVTRRGGWPRPSKGEVPEMWRAGASLEFIDATQKKMLGTLAIDELKTAPSAAMFWSLARIGARAPAYGPANTALPADVIEPWLRTVLELDWKSAPAAALYAVVSLARKTGDRARDIPEGLRLRIVEKLRKTSAPQHDIESIQNVTALEMADRKAIFGDAPPPALRLLE